MITAAKARDSSPRTFGLGLLVSHSNPQALVGHGYVLVRVQASGASC